METCINVYLAPLREATAKKKPIIDEQQIRAIFSDIEIIHGFNKRLLSELEPIVGNFSPQQCLGNIFLKIVRHFFYLINSDQSRSPKEM